MHRYTLYNVYVSIRYYFCAERIILYIFFQIVLYQGQPSGEAFIQMDSEASAYACASQRHHRYMNYGKKQRYIEVFQCSGDDMNLVLTGAVTPPSTKALLSPGTLTTQTSATLTHPSAPTAMPVPVPTAQPPPPPLWDIHALVHAQAAQAAQAQAVQAQAIRNQDFWLMALASNPSSTSTTPASPTMTAAAAAAAVTSKSLALQSQNPAVAQIPAAYAMASPAAVAAAAALHAPSASPAAAAAVAPFLLFNVHPHHHHPRIPILRAPTSHGLLAPIAMAATPALNPAAIISLKRTWDATFPANAANTVAAKRTTWHAPAAAFHAPAPTAATPGLPYPAQFYPQI